MSLSALEQQPSLPEVARELLEKNGHRQVSILVTGKVGTGKSALINGLVGDEVAPESDSIQSATTGINSYIANIHGIAVKLWDTPGITVATDDEVIRFQALQRDISQVDLVLYCLKMDDLRIQKQDTTTIRHFTQAFGSIFWKNAIFALTFANKVLPPRNYNDLQARQAFFRERWGKWAEELRETLQKAGVPSYIVDTVSFIPAGHYNDPSLPDGRGDWLGAFWSTSLLSIKNQGKLILLRVNLDQLKPYDTVQRVPYHSSELEKSSKNRLYELLLVYGAPTSIIGLAGYFLYGFIGIFIGIGIGALLGHGVNKYRSK